MQVGDRPHFARCKMGPVPKLHIKEEYMGYVISYDVGTTGVKTCLFSIGEKVELVDGAYG